MKNISIKLARSIWLCPIQDINPKGLRLDIILIPALLETYRFRTYPKTTEVHNLADGIKFGGGEFIIDDEYPIDVSLTIYSDGIVVDTRYSTSKSNAFVEHIDHILSPIEKIQSIKSTVREKLYLSQIYFSSEMSLETINPKMRTISEYLSENVESNKKFELGALSFWPDQYLNKNPTPFTVERVAGEKFSENKYYSAAPLTTNKHLEIIEGLEKLLS